MKYSIAIPTYNRESDLFNCLDSILLQILPPSEVVIIDDGNLSDEFIMGWKDKMLDKNIAFVYYKKNHYIERKGLSESKNKAAEIASNDIFFIFDDDIVLEEDFCYQIMKVWEKEINNEHLIGVGGIIKNRRKRSRLEKYFHYIFGISSKLEWDVNKVCFQIWDEEITEPVIGYYAHGGVCSYKRNKIIELRFTTFTGGRTALEDVDFCLRAKINNYHFIIEPRAKLNHYPSKASREGNFLVGYKESCNRLAIFSSINKKPTIFLTLWFYWASFGWILRQLLVGNFSKGAGMLKGLILKTHR